LFAEKINTNWHLYQSGKRNILKACDTFGKPETITKKYHQNSLNITKPEDDAIFATPDWL
jgi:hypothetical protein